MKALAFLFVLAMAGCTTVAKLQSADSCRVWEPQSPLPPRSVAPHGASAKYEGKCTILGLFGCLWVQADLDQTGDIYLEGNSIFESRTKSAHLKDSTVTFEPSLLDKIAKAGPAKIDPATKTVVRQATLTALGLNKSSEESVYFNDHCSIDEAAVGAVALWASRSKDQ